MLHLQSALPILPEPGRLDGRFTVRLDVLRFSLKYRSRGSDMLQTLGLPAPPAGSSFEWWLIGCSVLGVGFVFRWLTTVLTSKDAVLQTQADRQLSTLIGNAADMAKLTASIHELAENVASANRINSETLVSNRQLVDLVHEQNRLKDEHIDLLKQQVSLLQKQLTDRG